MTDDFFSEINDEMFENSFSGDADDEENEISLDAMKEDEFDDEDEF